jgi:hypothetical protein
MATAAIEGQIDLVQYAMNMVAMVVTHRPDNRPFMAAFASAYCGEFDPTPDMLDYIQHPSLTMHERLVDSFIRSSQMRRLNQLAPSVEKMCNARHYQPLAKLLDWALESQRHREVQKNDLFIHDIARLLNAVGIHAHWDEVMTPQEKSSSTEDASLKMVLDTLKPHRETLASLYAPDIMSDGDLWCGWISPAVVKGLVASGNGENAGIIFHEYCMTTADDDLIAFMVKAGISAEAVEIDRRIQMCNDASIGAYPHSAMAMHIASDGAVPINLDFEIIGGRPFAKAISKQCSLYGTRHAQTCATLIAKFLEHNASDGLSTYGLPREILELMPELAEENLASSLGL